MIRPISIVILILLGMGCSQQPTKSVKLLAGTYTGSGSDGIYRLSFDPSTGKLENEGLAVETINPSYLAIDKAGEEVYSVNETDSGSISSFRWNQERTSLELLSTQSSEGAYPCYIDFDREKSLVVTGNYMTGNLVAFRVEDGLIQPSPAVFQHEGTGPNTERQERPHAHCTVIRGDYIYVADLGIDQIVSYRMEEDGTIGPGKTALQLDGGDGPRHLVFHPTKDLAFVVNELSNSVISLSHNPASGTFVKVSKAGTLPEDFKGHSQCADIHLSPEGRFLYVSNRGHNSLAIFSVSDEGHLRRIGVEPTRGDWPRNFTLSPDGDYLLVANERSDNIVVFRRNSDSGMLTYTENELKISKPVCLKF